MNSMFFKPEDEDFKAGSIGIVCEVIDEDYVFVEFDSDEYGDSVISVCIEDLELIKIK